MKKAGPVLLLMLLLLGSAQAADDQRLDWFRDAKLGIFIHWGIYAVDGVGESWSFYNGHLSHEEYMQQLDGFTADRYDPAEWARLIKDSGARYAVLTAKHHDGVALYDSKVTDLNVVRRTPAGRDLLGPWCDAIRDAGLKVGLYYSLIDWSDPLYPNFTRKEKRYEDDPERWARFMRKNHAQIREISRRFHPDLVWFDGDWEFSAEQWQAPRIREMLLADNPRIVLNSRLQGHGDYGTPEQGVPLVRPDDDLWELCLTMNDSWGYYPTDTNYKTPNQIIRIFVDCLSMGGNLLLDIGPRADGTICAEQQAILAEMGRWTRKHAEAVYATRAGLPCGWFHGPSARSADGRTIFLYLPHPPNGPVMLKGLPNKVKRVRVVGDGRELPWDIKMKLSWNDRPGILYMEVPADAIDPQVTVLAIDLEEPLSE